MIYRIRCSSTSITLTLLCHLSYRRFSLLARNFDKLKKLDRLPENEIIMRHLNTKFDLRNEQRTIQQLRFSILYSLGRDFCIASQMDRLKSLGRMLFGVPWKSRGMEGNGDGKDVVSISAFHFPSYLHIYSNFSYSWKAVV